MANERLHFMNLETRFVGLMVLMAAFARTRERAIAVTTHNADA